MLSAAWIAAIVISVLLLGAAATVIGISAANAGSDPGDIKGRHMVMRTAEATAVSVVDDAWSEVAPDPTTHEVIGIVPVTEDMEVEEPMAAVVADVVTRETVVTAPPQLAPAVPPPQQQRRPRAMVYKRRDPTGWYAPVHRIELGFYGITILEAGVPLLTYGEDPGPPTMDPPYKYDSMDPAMIIPQCTAEATTGTGVVAAPAMMICATYIVYTVEVLGRLHRLRLCLSCGGDTEFGDVQLWNDETEHWEYYGEQFTIERPSEPLAIVPEDRYGAIKEAARAEAMPIPVELLNAVHRPIPESSFLDLIADTAMMFRREPPQNYSRRWVMENVCSRSFTQSVSAIVG